MSRSKIEKFRKNLLKDPSHVYTKALPYINEQVEHLSHLKLGTAIAKRTTRATLEASSLYERAGRLLGIRVS